MKHTKILSYVLASTMVLSAMATTASAANTSELSGQWYETAMTTWINRGVISGDEYGYRAEAYITRGELATMLDQIMDYQVTAYNSFYDLSYSKFYTQPILGAVQAGVISGDTEGTMRPESYITREETAVILARVLNLDETDASSANFSDQYKISNYAVDSVNAMYEAGYIVGDEFGFRPQDSISRAEVATMLNNMFPGYVAYAGTYTSNVYGNCVITTGYVTLQDMTVTGTVIIAEGVAEGDVDLTDMTIDGDLIIRGGGENTVTLENTTVNGTIYIEKDPANTVHVVLDDDCNVNDIIMQGDAILEVDSDLELDTVYVRAGATAQIEATIDTLVLQDGDGDGADVTIEEDAEIDTIEIYKAETQLRVEGTVSRIEIDEDAEETDIDVYKTADIGTIVIDAEDVTIDGKGDVSKIYANADDATIDVDGARVYVSKYADGVEVDGDEIDSGDTVICGDGYDDDDDEHRVRFYVDDDNDGKYDSYDSVYVDDDDNIGSKYMPDDPDHDSSNYEFVGWFTSTDPDMSDWFDYKTEVSKNTSVYALFRDTRLDGTIDVTYNTNGGTEIASTTGLDQYDTISAPTSPTKANYRFAGWYSNASLTTRYDFNTLLKTDTTLYASWVADSAVTTEAQLISALDAAESGDLVSIAGNITLTDDLTIPADVTVEVDGTLTVDSSLTINGELTGSGDTTVTGSLTIGETGSITVSGDIVVESTGTFYAYNSVTSGTTTVIGGILQLNSGSTATLSLSGTRVQLKISGDATISSDFYTMWPEDNSYQGVNMTVSSGKLTVTGILHVVSANSTGSTLTIANGATLDISGGKLDISLSGEVTCNGTITGEETNITGADNISGSGTWPGKADDSGSDATLVDSGVSNDLTVNNATPLNLTQTDTDGAQPAADPAPTTDAQPATDPAPTNNGTQPAPANTQPAPADAQSAPTNAQPADTQAPAVDGQQTQLPINPATGVPYTWEEWQAYLATLDANTPATRQ